MANEYFWQYADGSIGNYSHQRGADGKEIAGTKEGKLLGRADGKGGYTLNNLAGTGVPSATAAPAPSYTSNASWGGGTGTIGTVPATTSTPAQTPAPAPGTGTKPGGLISGSIAPAPLAAPTQWNITNDQTVAGQIRALTDPNSALAQQYQTAGMKQAASRGLLNSSMAATAGMDSLLRGITPIATSDAETNAKAAGYNADQSNQFSQLAYTQGNAWANSQADRQNALTLAGLNNNASMAQAQLSAETQRYIAETNAASSQTTAKLNNEYQAALQAEKNKHDALMQTSSAAANAYQQYANAMLNIQIQPSMNEAAKAAALANARNAYQFAMAAAYKIAGANLPDFGSLLDFSAPDPAAAPAPVGSNDGRTVEDINAGNGA